MILPPKSSVDLGLSQIEVLAQRGDAAALEARQDWVVVEEPLQIRVAGEPLAITMRTPGQDHELVAGFLLSEGLIERREDLGTLVPCGRPGEEGYGNVIDVLPAPGRIFDFERAELTRRGTLTTSSCGVCGRRTIDDLLARCLPLDSGVHFAKDELSPLTALLAAEQPNFRRTGGVHAAALAKGGRIELVREDVGRHNAVDKLFGRLLLDAALPADESVLVVSGRTSFEIVQKALSARVCAIVGVSAPSSLAIRTAERAGLLLIGFARDRDFNVYAGKQRLASAGR